MPSNETDSTIPVAVRLTDDKEVNECVNWDQQVINQARASKGIDPAISTLLLAVSEHLEFYRRLLSL